jgi:hypothetical protein
VIPNDDSGVPELPEPSSVSDLSRIRFGTSSFMMLVETGVEAEGVAKKDPAGSKGQTHQCFQVRA